MTNISLSIMSLYQGTFSFEESDKYEYEYIMGDYRICFGVQVEIVWGECISAVSEMPEYDKDEKDFEITDVVLYYNDNKVQESQWNINECCIELANKIKLNL